MAKNYSELWNQILADIRERVSDTQYRSFFEPVRFLEFDTEKRKLVLQVNSVAHAEYLEGPFKPILKATVVPVFGAVNLAYRPLAQTPAAHEDAAHVEEPQADPIATNLYTSYTFSTFVEGEANKLARSIGMSIAEHPRSTKFNPMFVYGPSGCGKTHLINAIGLDIVARYPKKKVLYVGAREFRDQYVKAQIVDNNVSEFIAFYQQFDVLIVDDVQEWESSPKATETFFHIFNHLFMNKRRIILAADRTPAELKRMDERMISRFLCGMVAELGRPDHKLCVDILNSMIARERLSIPNDVVEYIARRANGSVRELEGVINSLLAFSMMGTGEIDMPLAEKVCKQRKPEKVGKYDINAILDSVSDHYNIPVDDIIGKSRKAEIANARQVAMYLSQKMAHAQTTRIGRFIGGRDHSTVKHSIDKVVARLDSDKAFAREVKTIESEIKSSK